MQSRGAACARGLRVSGFGVFRVFGFLGFLGFLGLLGFLGFLGLRAWGLGFRGFMVLGFRVQGQIEGLSGSRGLIVS